MTRKRYKKLLWAYFTELNEWAKKHPYGVPMDMGHIYQAVRGCGKPGDMDYGAWWEKLKETTDTFGVGEKGR